MLIDKVLFYLMFNVGLYILVLFKVVWYWMKSFLWVVVFGCFDGKLLLF